MIVEVGLENDLVVFVLTTTRSVCYYAVAANCSLGESLMLFWNIAL